MRKIAIVDDDADIRHLVEVRLRAAGYEVASAADGESGLALIRAQRPALVLLDLMMPRMHGYAVCQEMRNDPALRSTPVIITSAKSYSADLQKAKEVGADGYLTKPYDLDQLVEKVRQAIDAAGPPVLVKFWGTRGSIPTPGRGTLKYGGNTSCVEVRCGGEILMFDCGTGAREMGRSLHEEFEGRELHVNIFVGHTHWDHIQGFPFFQPAYTPGTRLTIHSLRGSDRSLEKVFTGQMDSCYFPVSMGDLTARLHFVELDGPVKVGDAQVSHIFLNHPGLAIGFRVDAGRKAMVYVSDHESYCRMSGDNDHNRRLDQGISDFAKNADLYIREAQYTEEEYTRKRGWGHSIWRDAVDSAHAAGARMLALFHHDPTHDDDAMDRIVGDCHAYMTQRGMKFSCFAAADQMQLTL